MTEARRREGVGFRPRPSNDAASVKHLRRSTKQKRTTLARLVETPVRLQS